MEDHSLGSGLFFLSMLLGESIYFFSMDFFKIMRILHGMLVNFIFLFCKKRVLLYGLNALIELDGTSVSGRQNGGLPARIRMICNHAHFF